MRPNRTYLRPKKGPEKCYLWQERINLRFERGLREQILGLRTQKSHFRAEKSDFGVDRTDFKPVVVDAGSRRAMAKLGLLRLGGEKEKMK